ncbi:MAG: response regulator [Leptospiraceae bacterium]|nr:MAG: response regulator [Leptospiraceae bacterium]
MQKEKHLLLVDDNDKYAKILTEYFQKKSYIIDRAYDGKEALEILQSKDLKYYDIILTDITMESQLAGLTFLKKARQIGYKGKIIIASTGFNYSIAMFLAPLFLNHLKVDYLIPKTSVLKNQIEFYPCKFLANKEKEIVL